MCIDVGDCAICLQLKLTRYLVNAQLEMTTEFVCSFFPQCTCHTTLALAQSSSKGPLQGQVGDESDTHVHLDTTLQSCFGISRPQVKRDTLAFT